MPPGTGQVKKQMKQAGHRQWEPTTYTSCLKEVSHHFTQIFWFFQRGQEIWTFFYASIYLFERAWPGEEADGEEEADSLLSREPHAGSIRPEIMTWAKDRHFTNWATQAPLKVMLYFYFFKDCIYLFDRKSETAQAGGAAEGEEEADSLLSRDPNVGLDSRTLGSWLKLKADA